MWLGTFSLLLASPIVSIEQELDTCSYMGKNRQVYYALATAIIFDAKR